MCTNNFLEPLTPPLDPALQSEYSSSPKESPVQFDLQGLSNHIRMGDHAYMKARTMQVHDGLLTETSLPESCHAHTTPSTSAYDGSDIQTYTTVSPYISFSTPQAELMTHFPFRLHLIIAIPSPLMTRPHFRLRSLMLDHHLSGREPQSPCSLTTSKEEARLSSPRHRVHHDPNG